MPRSRDSGGHSAPLSDPSESGAPPEPSKCPHRDPPTLPRAVRCVCSRRRQRRGTLQDNHGAGGDLLARAWPAPTRGSDNQEGTFTPLLHQATPARVYSATA